MRKSYSLFTIPLYFIFLFLFSLHSFAKSGNPSEQKVKEWLKQSHYGFIENKGQVVGLDKKPVKEVLFKTSIKNSDIYITTSGITYVLKKQLVKDTVPGKSETEEDEKSPIQWCRMEMKLVGASINKENIVTEEQEQQGYINYYLPSCPNGILNVNTYDKITIKNIYPGIDWIIYNNNEDLKYDFILHPGADPSLIKLSYAGADDIRTEENGSMLILKTTLGTIQEGALRCYQGKPSNSIPTKYVLVKNEINFDIGKYDSHSDLVIDPPVDLLQWATYYGGESSSHLGPRGICTDASGNIYITGYTDCSLMPVQDPGGGAYYNGTFISGTYASFIIKFNSAGVRQWATYYGGSNEDQGKALVADASGNLFLTGMTGSGDLPTKNPGGGAYFQSTLSGGSDFDLFISKFSPAGVLLWSTYYGGSLDDQARAADIDASGNLWITGYTTSTDFPTLNPGGGAYYQSTFGGMPAGDNYGDAFILKFDNNGKQIWGTYYGGSDQEEGYSINAAPTGDILVTGFTASTNLPILNPGGGSYYQAANGGGNDLFIAKFSNAGVQLWGTYYGGSGNEGSSNEIHTIGGSTIDKSGNIYVTGATLSSNFPLLNPGGTTYFQAANAGSSDAFILKFKLSGVPVWATYYGGSSTEEGNAIITDASRNVYVTGESVSSALPLLNPGGGAYYQAANGGGMDIFITEFDSTGTLAWGTFFGGNMDDWSGRTSVSPSGCLAMTGEWTSTSGVATQNPGGGAYYQSTLSGAHDGFIMQFCPVCNIPAVSITPSSPSICADDSVVLKASGAGTYTWIPGTGLSTTSGATVTAKPGTTTTYTVIGSVGGTCNDTVHVTVSVNPMPTVSITPATATICSGSSIVLTANGATNYTWKPAIGLSCTNCPNPDANPSLTTTYSVTGSTGSCSDSSTATITVNPSPTVIVSPNVTITLGDSTALSATGGGTYLWTPATDLSCTTCATTEAKPTSTTTYCVHVTGVDGCTDSACVTVTVEIQCGQVFVPDAFSPNGDGFNDVLYVRGKCIQTLDFVIYDRWGNKVFETTDPTIGWDGKFKGQPLNTGTFAYYMTANTISNQTITKKGNISLVR